jgi:hypothetical protein
MLTNIRLEYDIDDHKTNDSTEWNARRFRGEDGNCCLDLTTRHIVGIHYHTV